MSPYKKFLVRVALSVTIITGVTFFIPGHPQAKAQGGTFENIPAPDEKGPYNVGIRIFNDVQMSEATRKTTIQVFYPTNQTHPNFDPNGCPDTYTIQVVPPPGIAGTYKISSPLCAVQDATVAAGPFPLVVHDHGGATPGNERARLEELPVFETLASHGFVVAVALHSGNAIARVNDLSLVINVMLGLIPINPPNPLSGSIDPNRIGISGFSAGGLSARLVAGGWHPPGNPPPPAIPADPRIKAMVLYEPAPDAASLPDAATISFPYLVMGGNRFNGGLKIPELFDATVLAMPRIHVLNPEALHFSYFSGLCSLVDETREAALSADPNLPEPLTNMVPDLDQNDNCRGIDPRTGECRRVCNTNINPNITDPTIKAADIKAAAFDACLFWNRGEIGFPMLGIGVGGGRNFCTRIGANPNSARSLDADGDGFTDAFLGGDPLFPLFEPNDKWNSDASTIEIPPTMETMVPMVKLYTVAFWKKFLAGDGRYMRYLTPGYANTHNLQAVVEIRE